MIQMAPLEGSLYNDNTPAQHTPCGGVFVLNRIGFGGC